MPTHSNPQPITGGPSPRHALAVLTVAVLLYFPFLGFSGFAHSEGFRVYPGWEMLERGDWITPRLFGQVYLRKPPLVPWLHGAAAWLFGESEAVARGVSSAAIVGMCMACFAFAQRWFGRPWGLVAGLACAVMPLLYWYPPGRAAEIEPVHNCCTLLAVCLLIDHTLGSRRGPLGRTAVMWGLALAFAGMLLAKGPAGVPVLLAVLAAAMIAVRSVARPLSPRILLMLLAGTLLFGLWFIALRSALTQEAAPPVVEPPGRFLFKDGRWLPVIALPLSALVAALPHSLALLKLPWRAGASPAPAHTTDRHAIACTLAWTVTLSLLAYTLIGIGNSRYALPALVLMPLCVAAAGERCWGVAARAGTGQFRQVWAVGRTVFIILLVTAAAEMVFAEYRRTTRTSGRPDALRLGEVLNGKRADHVELWGDQLVDTRPEVLRYACDRAYELGQFVTPRWKPRRPGDPPQLPPPGSYYIARTDLMPRDSGEDPEWPLLEAAGVGKWPLVFEGKAHNFEYRVYLNPTP